MGNIYITGFMAAGKSSVGEKLARRWGWSWVDLDALITASTGSQVADILTERGEEYFRDIEEEILAEVAQKHNQVVSTGGGVILRETNRSLLKRSGIVVGLHVSLAESQRRCTADGGPGQRPLLHQASQRYEAREPLYREADVLVHTDGKSVEDVVSAIIKELDTPLTAPPLSVAMASGSYDLIIRPTILGKLGTYLKQLGARQKVMIVSDTNVWPLYAKQVDQSLQEADLTHIHWNVTPQETYKSLTSASQAYDFLLEKKITRDTFCVALGGGLAGDLAGFIAATYMRGLPFVQVPTSLLAQVDASVGGKVAVNHTRAKNSIGTFYHPRLCLIDPLVLRSLPRRQYIEGLAEVIKYALLEGQTFLDELLAKKEAILAKDPLVLRDIIAMCCASKARHVMADEKDHGLRRHLNLGHTLGHALETLGNYTLLHGEAVALGLVWAGRISSILGLAEKDLENRIQAILRAFDLPVIWPETMVPPERETVAQTMLLDKKADHSGVKCIVLAAPGQASVQEQVSASILMEAMESIGL